MAIYNMPKTMIGYVMSPTYENKDKCVAGKYITDKNGRAKWNQNSIAAALRLIFLSYLQGFSIQ